MAEFGRVRQGCSRIRQREREKREESRKEIKKEEAERERGKKKEMAERSEGKRKEEREEVEEENKEEEERKRRLFVVVLRTTYIFPRVKLTRRAFLLPISISICTISRIRQEIKKE